MKVVKVNVPIYFGKLQIIVTNNFEKALKKFKLSFDGFKPDDYSAFAYQKTPGDQKYFLFIQPKTTPSIIAHESVHIVNYIFNDTHVQMDSRNDEPYAYMMGWVVSNIHNALKEYKK